VLLSHSVIEGEIAVLDPLLLRRGRMWRTVAVSTIKRLISGQIRDKGFVIREYDKVLMLEREV
jgi:hypothetical protein